MGPLEGLVFRRRFEGGMSRPSGRRRGLKAMFARPRKTQELLSERSGHIETTQSSQLPLWRATPVLVMIRDASNLVLRSLLCKAISRDVEPRSGDRDERGARAPGIESPILIQAPQGAADNQSDTALPGTRNCLLPLRGSISFSDPFLLGSRPGLFRTAPPGLDRCPRSARANRQSDSAQRSTRFTGWPSIPTGMRHIFPPRPPL